MPLDLLASLRTETARCTALLRDGDPAAPVVPCPGWTVHDLAVHLGNVHRWATTAVLGRGEKPAYGEEHPAGALADWYAGTADGLLTALTAAAPDDPAWGFGPPPHTAAFWRRRQLHEAAVHRRDLETALGRGGRLDAELAADGVDELLSVFLPRQLRLGRLAPLPAAVELATGDRSWTVGDGAPVATVAGPAEALLLLLWHRTGPDDDRLTVTGDRAAAEQVLALPLAP